MSVTNFQDRAIQLLEAIADGGGTGGGGGGTGGGDASAANQTTEIARLDSLVTAIASQSTATKQDAALTELQALVVVIANQSTAANQTTEIARLDSLVTAIANQATAANQALILAALNKSYVRSFHTLNMATANAEYSTASATWSTPVDLTNARSVRFGIRGQTQQLRWSFTAGRVGTFTEPYALRLAATNASPYVGPFEIKEGIPSIIYFAAPGAGLVLEFEVLHEV
jgi:hypothetical protein